MRFSDRPCHRGSGCGGGRCLERLARHRSRPHLRRCPRECVDSVDWRSAPPSPIPTRAMLARTGEVPMAPAKAFRSRRPPTATAPCSAGAAPTGGWPNATRTAVDAHAYDGTGRLMVNVARRPGFHSREVAAAGRVVRRHRRPSVSPGNWLPVAPVDRFTLMLRLYDTPLATGSQLVNSPCRRSTRSPAHDLYAALVAAGLLLGGIIHIAIVFLVPYYAPSDAWRRWRLWQGWAFHTFPPRGRVEPLLSRSAHGACGRRCNLPTGRCGCGPTFRRVLVGRRLIVAAATCTASTTEQRSARGSTWPS